MRVFLSHSSKDKPIVEEVAKTLGRQKVFIDKYNIDSTDTIKESIKSGLIDSDVFCAFFTKESLKSDWVRFEVSFAEKLALSGQIKKVISFILDDTEIKQIPDFFKGTLVRSLKNPKFISQDIINAYNKIEANKSKKYFIGRNEDLNKAEIELTSDEIDSNPSLFLVWGLPGIGRRTFLKKVSSNILNFSNYAEVSIYDGDSPAETLLRVKDYIDPVGPIEASDIISQYDKEHSKKYIDLILKTIFALNEQGVMPYLFDEGGLLDEDGYIYEEFDELLNAIHRDTTIYCCVVSRRKLAFRNECAAPSLRLNPIDCQSTERLISKMSQDEGVAFTIKQRKQLTEMVSGYPLSARFAIKSSKDRGVDYILNYGSEIISFKNAILSQTLDDINTISETAKEIISLLSMYQGLPLPIIHDYLPHGTNDFHESLRSVLDLAIVSPQGNRYFVANPVREAVFRKTNAINVNHLKVAELIELYLDSFDPTEDDESFALREALAAATLMAGKPESQHAVQTPSALIDAARKSYRAEDFNRAIELCEKALKVRPENRHFKSDLARALIKGERFDDADDIIGDLRRAGYLRQASFLAGFSYRRRHMHNEAIESYQASIRHGRDDVAVHRELAQCFFSLGMLPEAKGHIELAKAHDSDNKFVIDLECQIAIQIKDEQRAREAATALFRLDDHLYAAHRLSTVEYAFGDYPKAFSLSSQVIEEEERPHFHVLAHYVKCAIEVQEYFKASKELAKLDSRFSTIKHEIRIGLRIKLLNSQENYSDAIALWETLHDKSLPVQISLRAKSIMGLKEKGIASAEMLEWLDEINSMTINDIDLPI